jgi:hypothetical protein
MRLYHGVRALAIAATSAGRGRGAGHRLPRPVTQLFCRPLATRLGLLLAILCTLSVAATALPGTASALIYWSATKNGTDTINTAEVDGTNQHVLGTLPGDGGQGVRGLAVTDQYIYVADLQGIGRLNLDGSGFVPAFVPLSLQTELGLLGEVPKIVVSGSYIYWVDPSGGSIGRANLDGSNPQPAFLTPASGNNVVSLALGGSYIYWDERSADAVSAQPETIDRANLDGTGRTTLLSQPVIGALAVDGSYIYWVENNTIARAALDGSGIDEPLITTSNTGLQDLEADLGHIYWQGVSGAIGSADPDGSNVVQALVSPSTMIFSSFAVDQRQAPPSQTTLTCAPSIVPAVIVGGKYIEWPTPHAPRPSRPRRRRRAPYRSYTAASPSSTRQSTLRPPRAPSTLRASQAQHRARCITPPTTSSRTRNRLRAAALSRSAPRSPARAWRCRALAPQR